MKINIRLFKYRYYLTIKPDYCGAITECLYPRLGESWLRGNDLIDGRLKDLPKVLWDILAHEFSFGRWKKQYETSNN